ncbi:hypothetical protein SAMN05216174_102331 [Actinokineospora iranica]|uniref:Uncharacterized protein n=1 Tax=Actinokineospora iranica TaxID=1271860 RepID=A0A1G6M138_9PSEU|nr:hypothetical protein SAMN05216174_102331 [Actinokineospora iranica]
MLDGVTDPVGSDAPARAGAVDDVDATAAGGSEPASGVPQPAARASATASAHTDRRCLITAAGYREQGIRVSERKSERGRRPNRAPPPFGTGSYSFFVGSSVAMC